MTLLILFKIVAVCIIWSLCWHIEYTIFNKLYNFTYTNSPIAHALLYISTAMICILLFFKDLLMIKQNINISGWIIFAVTGLVGFIYYRFVAPQVSNIDRTKYTNMFFSKFAEIIFQQTIFILLIILLNQNLLQFIIVIIIIHLPTYYYLDKKYSTIFTLASIPGSIIFFMLITQFQNGIFLAFLVHLLFYIILNYLILKKVIKLPVLE